MDGYPSEFLHIYDWENNLEWNGLCQIPPFKHLSESSYAQAFETLDNAILACISRTGTAEGSGSWCYKFPGNNPSGWEDLGKIFGERYQNFAILPEGQVWFATAASFTRSTQILDTTTLATRQGPQLKHPIRFTCILQINATSTIVIGGSTSTTVIDDVDIYDSSIEAWKSNVANLPIAKRSFGCGIYRKSRIIIAGGFKSNYYASKSVESYDISSNSWSQAGYLPEKDEKITVVQMNGELYMYGGWVTESDTILKYNGEMTGTTWIDHGKYPSMRTYTTFLNLSNKFSWDWAC